MEFAMDAKNDQWTSHRELLSQAAVLKKDGNTAYGAKDYRKAIGKYHRAIILLKAVGLTQSAETELFGAKSAPRPPQEIIDERDRLKSECYNNLAATLLAQENPKYEKVVDHCTKALQFDPGNVKAIYRMGVALEQLGELEKATSILTSIPAVQSEKKIQALLRSVREKEKIKENEVKATYQRMFPSGADKQQSKQSNGFDHPDPVVIRSNVSTRIAGTPATESEGPSCQGTKFIQVASANEEAPC